MTYIPNPNRYDSPDRYRRCGRWGLVFPAVSLGLWHNFGQTDAISNSRKLLLGAFDLGITHFDLANNYGPPAGAAEQTLGRVLQSDLGAHRDELLISTKAGYEMWHGPYGDGGSRKYLLASLDQSLRRLGLDYVDIFYHHRPDPKTPLEETCGALAHAVRSGKALYVGLSNSDAETTVLAARLLTEYGTPCVIHQPKYNLLERNVEKELLGSLQVEGIGCIPFSPLAQGLLSNRYLEGIPDDARAKRDPRFLQPSRITPQLVTKLRRLDALAQRRGQTLAQMAVAWLLKDPRITSVLVGASRLEQLEDSLGACNQTRFDASELAELDALLAEPE
jgi:L-glyceraldehyde 3-phosphate reductase